MPTIRQDFVTFINQGNLVQLAIAFVIGSAFTVLMMALVSDLFTPIIGIAGHVNFESWTTTINGSTILQGPFLNALIAFVTIALVVFFIVALPYQRWRDRQAAKAAAAAPTTRACPECLSQIPLAAKRCSFCTAAVTPVSPPPAAPTARPS